MEFTFLCIKCILYSVFWFLKVADIFNLKGFVIKLNLCLAQYVYGTIHLATVWQVLMLGLHSLLVGCSLAVCTL